MITDAHTKIKQLRELKGITRKEMGDRLGIGDRAYAKIETGETHLTINRLNEISTILDIDPMNLLGFDTKQIFNDCKQEGYIGINYIQVPDKMMDQYESHIQSLKEQIQTLTSLLVK
ncbi:helix-turn-helix domain-containing protein [Pedobacter xixiisoli]|uniref:Helix-turn-helix n=1 Tax=Pedobacter xixiisoli TaxID=1476464 RepID=A0A286A726_9SPHI|nr:helix-turn-helix transcriptional regulator [Pedobacter xixiisoli]SOD17733.1 Helix-turn-helix [Pedobacter xixiisoli]